MSKKEAYKCSPVSDRVMTSLLESISAISQVTNDKNLDYDSRLDGILRVILKYLGVEHGSIMVREKKNLVVMAATRPEILGHKQPLAADSVAAWVGKSGEPLFIPNIIKDARFKSKSAGIYKDAEALSVPILLEEKVVGVINVTDKTRSHGVLKDDIACLLQFSSLILSLLAQQKMQDELKKQRNALKEKNRQLRYQEAKRAELSRMLVHDLKGPLSDVIANLDILSYSIPEAGKENLEAAQTGCDRAVRMVANLVTVGKIEDGEMELLKEKIDPGALIDESLSSVKGLAGLKGMVLVKDVEDGLPHLYADRILVLRVLQNFLNNSLGCSFPGSTITAGCRMSGDKASVEFFVKDDGPGISKDKQKIIFDKYATITCRENAVVGTGLGLYFCRLAVEEHQGSIGVESIEGQGSRFYFSLPVQVESSLFKQVKSR